MADHNELGQKGEAIARKFLVESGYVILETNWRYGRDEIDIIAQIANELVIVEVKTRHSDFFGDPHEFVSKTKQRALIRAANAYVEAQNIDLEVRFDIVGVIVNQHGQKLDHIPGAFQPTW